MKSIESAPEEPHIAEDVGTKIRDLLDGPPSNNYVTRQIQLIIEKFVVEYPEDILDNKKLNELGLQWAESPLSNAFNKITEDPRFKSHPRFSGNVANITLENVQAYVKTGIDSLFN
ncbi:MAG: hypothetical protein COV91_03020 [Candidatus Taylorbacteria bacterium CG11_big_fil_rev_8_21_14_0_20_46_11]|uniref:Uncharacterized protein n=1 Tax=Candidatus Taylorbacteria bacterium CG11_big_fil_rev_8_21_14_0_20_46_11 TaxID=1975025 RepID=A0A2H0KBR5_9BACT|nr:MAG: hypothetical protein COV91_03020 [Candidatus Taylorbacteria bacterium CG11_big_fil_rev_8_21_14_0_20_46_11]